MNWKHFVAAGIFLTGCGADRGSMTGPGDFVGDTQQPALTDGAVRPLTKPAVPGPASSFDLSPLAPNPYIAIGDGSDQAGHAPGEVGPHYEYVPTGLRRADGTDHWTNSAGGNLKTDLDRPMNFTFGDYLNEDFVAELHVTRPPHSGLDLIWFGFGEGDPHWYNEPSDSFLFRIHSSGGYTDIDAVANKHWGPWMDSAKLGQFDGDMTFRIEKAGTTVTLSVPELGLSKAFDTSLLPHLAVGHFFFGNSLPGAIFTSFQVTVAGGVQEVDIDIKPGSDRNPINLRAKGVIPVAVLSTEDFDATTIDPSTVSFGPDGAAEAHGKGHIEDVDRDGDNDLVLHFATQDAGLSSGDTEATLTGATFDGQEIVGTDVINIGGKK